MEDDYVVCWEYCRKFRPARLTEHWHDLTLGMNIDGPQLSAKDACKQRLVLPRMSGVNATAR